MSITYSIIRACVSGVYRHSLNTPAVLDMTEYFPGGYKFAHEWRTIRQEALAVASTINAIPLFHEIMPEQHNISAADDKDWRMLILKAYGRKIEKNSFRCPTLSALVASNPEVLSASLSFLAAGKQVPVHTGPFRGITRFYLGLVVPVDEKGEPGSILTIDGMAHNISEGEALLWDDTYPHSVCNNTGQVRIALLLDVYRANMSLPLRIFSNFCIWMAATAMKTRRVFHT